MCWKCNIKKRTFLQNCDPNRVTNFNNLTNFVLLKLVFRLLKISQRLPICLQNLVLSNLLLSFFMENQYFLNVYNQYRPCTQINIQFSLYFLPKINSKDQFSTVTHVSWLAWPNLRVIFYKNYRSDQFQFKGQHGHLYEDQTKV